jgi:hypothetical protein
LSSPEQGLSSTVAEVETPGSWEWKDQKLNPCRDLSYES